MEQIRLEGHTEIFGKRKDQYELAMNRVKSVRGYLVRQGIEEKRIDVKSYAGDKPKTKGLTEEERAKNRRVEMRILHQ
ncbi:MAG: OmpA family protein [Bacteroidetes bacterium]|nr:MAG: OmpA family protein [Bacteroidota bacterium]